MLRNSGGVSLMSTGESEAILKILGGLGLKEEVQKFGKEQPSGNDDYYSL